MNLFLIFYFASILQVSSQQNSDFWISQLNNRSIDLQINALQKLGEIRVSKAIPALQRSLDSGEASVRYYAAMALGRYTYQESLEVLSNRLVKEEDVYVKAEIRRSLSRLKEYFEKQTPPQE